MTLTPSGTVSSPFADSFAANDLSSYTSTYNPGPPGSAATWTYNAASALTITFDAAAGNKVASGTTNTFSHTVASQSNRVLLVAVDAGATVSSVTYNGVALTSLGSKVVSGSEVLSLWYLVAPATGANNVVVTCSSTTFIIGASTSYYNVAQSSTFGTLASNSGTGTASTNTVTTTSSNQLVIDCVNNTAGSTNTATASQTKREQPASSGAAMGDKAATGAGMTLTWSFTSGNWAQLSVPMNPVTTAPNLSASGGTYALLQLNNWTAQNVTVSATMTQSDFGGLAFNIVDTRDYYELAVRDASSPAASNSLQLFKTVAGVRSIIGTSTSISFTRGISHAIAVSSFNTGTSTTISVAFDGTQVYSYTDSSSPLGIGGVGLRNDTGSGASSAIYTAFSATSNDIPALTTSVPTANYVTNGNFNFGGGGWTEAGALTGRITFPSSGTYGSGAVATLTFANQAVGSDTRSQPVTNTGSSATNYVIVGQQYCFSATINVTSAFVNSYAFLQLVFLDVSGSILSTTTSSNITSSSGAQRFSVSATAPTNAWTARVFFGGSTTSTTNSGTATFTALMLEPMWFPALYSYPSPICDFLQGDSVTLPDATAARFDRVFTGFITDLKVHYDGATRIYDVECTSADWLMENATLVNGTYISQTDQAVITGIVNSLSPRIIYGATPSLATGAPQALAYRNVPIVYAGVTVAGLQFADATIREVVNAMNSLTGFLFGVDPYYNLYYYPPFYNLAPYGFSSSPDNVTTFAYYDYSIEYDGSQIQNAVNVVGTTFSTAVVEAWNFQDASHTEGIQAGKTINVLLKHIPNAVPTTVNVGGTNISCGFDNGTGYGTASSIISSSTFGQPGLLSFLSPGYAAGVAISVTYAYSTLAYVAVQSPDSIGKFGRPLYSAINDSSLTSNAAATASGEATLQTYAQPRTTLTFKCQKMLQPGQVISFTSAPDSITAQHFTVNKVRAKSLGAGINEYEIEVGTYLDDFVDFFRNTQKALTRASHDPAAPIQAHNNFQQDSLSISDSLSIHT